MNPFQHIYHRYVDEAAFLWVLRGVAMDQPHYLRDDMRELEERLRSQLNGIMTAPEDAWIECVEALQIGEAGEVFTAAVTAFRCGHKDKIQQVVEMATESEQGLAGLASAFDFLPGQLCHVWLKKFFTSKNLRHKRVAMEACLLRGDDPAEYLNRILSRAYCREDIPLFVSCLKVAGQFKRVDVRETVVQAAQAEQEELQFYSLRAQLLIGDHNQVTKLEPFVMNDNPYRDEAIQLAFRLLPEMQARQSISTLAADENALRSAVMAMAVFGDPQVINWLLARMDQPQLAKICGEAFATITGAELEAEGLSRDEPECNEDSDNDEFVEIDDDERLPYPKVNALREWWASRADSFIAGQRYFLGQPINNTVLHTQLAKGYQRQRHMAALELALRNPSEMLVSTRGFIR